ncbi:MAG: hypothetical protein AAF602_09435 [Myxococcota bacterium]
MDWFDQDVDLDAAQAAFIAKGMRRVATADGHVHQRELNLIAAFEAELPEEGPHSDPDLSSDEIKETYLRSLILVALADGRMGETEYDAIVELAGEVGLPNDHVDSCVLAVKRRFLQVFAGVNIFRDAVVKVADDLGLSASELDALRQEA